MSTITVERATPYVNPFSLLLATLLSWVDAVDFKLHGGRVAPRAPRVALVIKPWSETPGWDAAQEAWADRIREVADRREPGRHRLNP